MTSYEEPACAFQNKAVLKELSMFQQVCRRIAELPASLKTKGVRSPPQKKQNGETKWVTLAS
eukprot:465617-Amphidinium_carterae.1